MNPKSTTDPTETLLREVKRTISRYGMIDRGDRIIVAVSGGPDSVCLLDILFRLRAEWDLELIVAHYDHGLRPHEDEAETLFVRDLAASLKLPFESERAQDLKGKTGTSLEERARHARYGFLEKLKAKLNAQKIALGHHLNDQAETVIMRLLRGSGPTGLAGIPPSRDREIIRPLIRTKRESIEAYLKDRGLSFVLDSSNSETRFLRNRVRLELIPALLEYQPRLVEHLGRTAEILREENTYLDSASSDWIRNNTLPGMEGERAVPIAPFRKLPQTMRARITKRLLGTLNNNCRGIRHVHIRAIDRLAQGPRSQGSLNLPGPIIVRRIYDRLLFTRTPRRKTPQFEYQVQAPGTIVLREINQTLSLIEMEKGLDALTGHEKGTAFFDAGKLTYPLTVRNIRAGDRFIPLGMSGHKKIKDFFIDLKVPSDERAETPLLLSRGQAVWLCGHRTDDRFKVTPQTNKILKATIS